jgi:hypothetical protein
MIETESDHAVQNPPPPRRRRDEQVPGAKVAVCRSVARRPF